MNLVLFSLISMRRVAYAMNNSLNYSSFISGLFITGNLGVDQLVYEKQEIN